MQRLLVLVRHGQSEGNRDDQFTGWRDVELSAQGREEATAAGEWLCARGIRFDAAFTSGLKRAQRSCSLMLAAMGQGDLPVIADPALDERDYGELTGLSKDEARRKWGVLGVENWRRSYDRAPPGGESLKDTGARVWPYYVGTILPLVLRGCTVLVVAHGNSLRALIMLLEGISGRDIVAREIVTAVPIAYYLNSDSTVASSEVLADLAQRTPCQTGSQEKASTL